MRAVEISPCRNHIRVSIPKCPGIVCRIQPKGVTVFSESIQIWTLWERSTEINVARLTRSQLVGVIVGPIVFLVMIVSALVLLLRRRRRNGVNGEDSFLD